jgi:response regulator RpfG family c-di-GMP phosphodiesterase
MTDLNLLKVPIKHLIGYTSEFLQAEIFVKVGEKPIRLTYEQDNFAETIKKLQAKGVQDIFMNEAEFRRLFELIKKRLHEMENNKSTTDQVPFLESTFSLAKDSFLTSGATEENILLCKGITIGVMKSLKGTNALLSSLSEFKKNCSEEFQKIILVSHLTMLMIDCFLWKSTVLKEKAAMAALFCDVLLKPEDFQTLKDIEDIYELPEHILKHPLQTCHMLKAFPKLVSQETLIIIEQHHEKPKGDGFPHKLSANRIHQLAAIFIIAQDFVEQLAKNNFDIESRFQIKHNLNQTYPFGTFAKALEALNTVINS